ncbi:MAG: NAD-dependent epimerase/dehydratase family protein [Myxococcales bacterium FL481]|nr:MAG: NAD-dependent epimerase/dehydratase family protein [Myxococcales bacterium FL481]
MRVLITGGAGFIGSHVADAALAQGWEVGVLDNLSTGHRRNVPSDASFFAVDLRDREATEGVIRDFAPQAVSHQAAQASVAVSVADPYLDVSANVVGSVNLFDACKKHGTRRVVFASTGGAIYGEVPPGERARVDWPGAPISPYAISKLAVDQLLDVYRDHHGLECSVLRYANVYGPRQDPHGEAGVVAIFFNRTLAGEALRINARRTKGDEGCIRDYTYVSDVARANILALEGKVKAPIVNIGTGTETTTRELAVEISRLTGQAPQLVPSDPRAGDLERSVLDPVDCTKLLGEMVEVADGLAKTHEWFRVPPAG